MPEIPFRKIVATIKRVLPKSFWENMPISIKKIVYLFEAVFACVYFGFPGRRLKVIGITGTDGKTTTSFLIYSILKTAGKNVALISTIGAKVGNNDRVHPESAL